MKTCLYLISCAAFGLMAVSSAETELPNPAPGPPGVAATPSPPPSRSSRPRVTPFSRGSSDPANGSLATNHRIDLTGNLGEKRGVALSLTGVGPEFTTDTFLQDESILTVTYAIFEAEDGFLIRYTVSVMTLVSSPNGNSSYRNNAIKGSVLLAPGTPVEIYKSGTHSLTLGIAELKAEK